MLTLDRLMCMSTIRNVNAFYISQGNEQDAE